MHAEVAKALKIPAVQERLTQIGIVSTSPSPEEFGKFIAHEVDRWAKVVRDHKIKAGE